MYLVGWKYVTVVSVIVIVIVVLASVATKQDLIVIIIMTHGAGSVGRSVDLHPQNNLSVCLSVGRSLCGKTPNGEGEKFCSSFVLWRIIFLSTERMNGSSSSSSPPPPPPPVPSSSSWRGLVERFELYGWQPNPNMSIDDNLMELLVLLTRNSTCRQGHMACILARPEPQYNNNHDNNKNNKNDDNDDKDSHWQWLNQCLVSVAINTSLYKDGDSDVHAEINALGEAAKQGQSTRGCTAYISMPPCKRCFGGLYAAGIVRIVTRRSFVEPVASACHCHGIAMVVVDDSVTKQRLEQATGSCRLVMSSSSSSFHVQQEQQHKQKQDMAIVVARRQARKQDDRDRKRRKRKQQQEQNQQQNQQQIQHPPPPPLQDSQEGKFLPSIHKT